MEESNKTKVTSVSVTIHHEDGSTKTFEGKYILSALLMNDTEDHGKDVCILECGQATRLEKGIVHESVSERIDMDAVMASHFARHLGLFAKEKEVNKDGDIQNDGQTKSQES